MADAAGILPGSLYHHFDSKEALAVALVNEFNEALTRMAVDELSAQNAEPAIADLTRLALRTATLARRHAAAVGLRTYDPPSGATDRLREAVGATSTAHDEAWRRAVRRVTAELAHPVDDQLLRFALQSLSVQLAATFPAETDPAVLVDTLVAIMLDGLALGPIDEAALAVSAPRQAAAHTIAQWGSAVPRGEPDLLEAARTEFSRRGYYATTMRDIARTAGVGMATVYRRFESKESLLQAILTDLSQRLDQPIATIAQTPGSPVEHLDALGVTLVRAARQYREQLRILQVGWAAGSSTGPFYGYYLSSQQRLSVLSDLIARGVEEGALRSVGDPTHAAQFLREIAWLPYQDVNRTGEVHAARFLRASVLQGLRHPAAG